MRAVKLLRDVTADATTGATVPLTPPAWADVVIIHVGMTAIAGTTPSMDLQVYQDNPDDTGTAIAVTNASIDALTQTGNSFIAFGNMVPAVSGTGYDACTAPLSREMEVTFTQDRDDTDETYTYKAWAEFIGYGQK